MSDLQRILTEMKERRILCRELDSATPEESRQVMRDMYAEWIKNDYDKEMEVIGFKSPFAVAETLSRFVSDKHSRILDCGSGTGLLGQELKKHGYFRIDALDVSKESLDYSRGKQVYTNYICDHLGRNRLSIEDGTYDAIGMSAAFGCVHIDSDCFPELLRITKPGGYVIFNVLQANFIHSKSCRNGALDGYLHNMAAEGKMEYLEKMRRVYIQGQQNSNTQYSYTYAVRVVGNQ